jgi:Resolvase, N terminal domain
MTDIRSLERTLIDNLPWNRARIKFVARFLLALCATRTVNLSILVSQKEVPTDSGASIRLCPRLSTPFAVGDRTPGKRSPPSIHAATETSITNRKRVRLQGHAKQPRRKVMKIAALYARVSSAKQQLNENIASQVAAIEEYARQNDYQISPQHVYKDDGFSGARLDRPALDRLRDAVAQGEKECRGLYAASGSNIVGIFDVSVMEPASDI